MLRREDDYVLKMALGFEFDGQRVAEWDMEEEGRERKYEG